MVPKAGLAGQAKETVHDLRIIGVPALCYGKRFGRGRALGVMESLDHRNGVDQPRGEDFTKTSLPLVRQLVGEQSVVYVPGYFPQSMPPDIPERFSVVHLDCDLYAPMQAGLAFFYSRLSPGGLLLLHDYSNEYFPGAKQAIDEFVATIPENLVLLPDKSGSAVVRKSFATAS